MSMYALSISQPWSWLIANGLKDIENRDWSTSYRGWFLIHAGKKLDPACFDGNDLYSPALYEMGVGLDIMALVPSTKQGYETGGIVGYAKLVDVVMRSGSPWFKGRYGFVLCEARPLPFYPLKGALGFFEVSDEIVAAIKQQKGA